MREKPLFILSVLGDKGNIPSFGKTFVLLCVLAAVFMIGEGRGFAGVFMLDEEAVFCVYHRISGETLSRQDIEDLCHASGKPTFTRYKPSEMFVHETLGKMRSRLEQKVKKYSKDTLFKWPVSVDRRMIQAGIDWNKGTIGLPQATPYIRPRFPKSGMRKVNRILSKRIQGMADQYPSIKKYTIHLYLRPVKVEDDLETRNIARTVVHLPIRTIVFHPVKTDVTPYGHPNNVLMSFVFSDS